MSIFGRIAAAIFGGPANAAEAPLPNPDANPAATATPPAAQTASAASPATSASPAGAAQAAKPAPKASVNVAAILDALDETSDEDDLDWRKSIVDVMKLLKINSSLKARKELAHELGYTGDTNDSATMNVWLHKQVMTKLAENGGIVPAELKH